MTRPPKETASAGEPRFMRMALAEAERARGATRPNPMVGCVVVKEGRVVGLGHHERAGAVHGEVAALRDAGPDARGADVYVNLEPCSHHGRTPPCTDALIEAGVRRVFAGMIDPNPKVCGSGVEQLRRAGIDVEIGLLEADCRRLNEGFVTHVRCGRPFVTLKLAVSLDGRIATRSGDSQWISSEMSRTDVHRRRRLADAILVGPNTLLHDDPRLTARLGGPAKHPAHRFAIDPELRVSEDAAILDTDQAETSLFCRSGPDEDRADALRARRVEVIELEPDERGHLPIDDVLREIGDRGVLDLLVEGGAGLAGSLFDAHAVDRLVLYVAPIVLGGTDAIAAVGGKGAERVADALRATTMTAERLGDDFRIIADFAHAEEG